MEYEYWLASIAGVNDKKKFFLKEYFGTAKEVYHAEEKELNTLELIKENDLVKIRKSKEAWDLKGAYGQLQKSNIQMVPYDSPLYPSRLRNIYQPPYALYVKGCLPEEKMLSIAIVGARKCTPYGEKATMEFASRLTSCGAQIISGLAMGIDGIGQRAALTENGKTYAVLGSGVDVCYPRNHIGLYMDILEHDGGIISEFLPKTRPAAWNFPMRNRIISGLSDVVLVMEAKDKSGSLITADMAMEQGKDVYALPGPVTSSFSQGCNRLIKQGAGILLTPEELVEDLMISGGMCLYNSKEKNEKKEIMLESTEKLVYSCLDFDLKNLDTIVRETKLPILEVMNDLISLELKGLIKEISKNHYVKI